MSILWYRIKKIALGPFKRLLKKILFKTLICIDPEFLTERSSHAGAVEPTALANRIARGTEPTSTLLVNDTAVLVNRDAVRLLVGAIFEMKKLSPAVERLLRYVEDNPALWVSYEEITFGIRKELLRWVASPEVEESSIGAELLASVERHRGKTQANREAYVAAGKENPNAVFWPDPTNATESRSLDSEVPWARTYRFISKSTPIGSAGSCFAFEIAHHLQRAGYNYVVTEPHVNPNNGFSNSCARWGIIFNTPSFRQLVERAFGEKNLPPIVWSQKRSNGTVFLDPFREDIEFTSIDEYEADKQRHVALVREALLKCEVFVITLGVNEVWSLKGNGAVFARSPWRIASDLVESRVMTVEENIAELEKMLEIYRGHNPKVKIIVSVSPVPLHATFRGDDQHVVTANAHSKAVLRVVAEEFAKRNEGVFYFPSYEAVMYCTRDAWDADQRHVSREAVENVMSLFAKMFLEE